MPRGKSLTLFQRGQINALNEIGLSKTDIALKIGKSRGAVRNFLRSPDRNEVAKGRGRKFKLTRHDEQKIYRAASNSTTSCARLSTLCTEKVHRSTVWRALNRNPNIVRSKMKMQPRLQQRHKDARMVFAEKNIGTDWSSVCNFF